MREINSVKNSITAIICYLISIVLGFITQSIVVKLLGAEYLGLNGLFSNILGMLGIFELGIGSSIIYNLYRPIAKNNIEETKSLMKIYKISYNAIAIVVLLFGLCMIPFLDTIVGKVTIDVNITLVYILFLLQTVVSYIFTYKRSIIIANQKNYIVNIVHIFYLIFINGLRLLILKFTKNYYMFLTFVIVGQLVENIILSIIANHKYKYLNSKDIKPISKELLNDIKKRIKALFFHNIGGIIVLSTDNIIISKFFGLVTVGIYSNYSMIINYVKSLFSQIIGSITASVGNLLVEENNKDKIFDIFQKTRFLNFWISCFTAISILLIINPFIEVWIGKEYLLTLGVLIAIVFDFFQKMMRNAYGTFKSASGTWIEDKYVPLVESALNIIFSIVCLKIFGLAGVFIGTIISGLALWCYSYPKLVYKKLFNRSYKDYAKETIGYILLFIIIAIITYLISLLFIVNNPLLQVVINCMICLIVPNFILFILFRKTSNFEYFIDLLKRILNRFLKK